MGPRGFRAGKIKQKGHFRSERGCKMRFLPKARAGHGDRIHDRPASAPWPSRGERNRQRLQGPDEPPAHRCRAPCSPLRCPPESFWKWVGRRPTTRRCDCLACTLSVLNGSLPSTQTGRKCARCGTSRSRKCARWRYCLPCILSVTDGFLPCTFLLRFLPNV